MDEEFDADLEDVGVATAALAYYLYRVAGCPFGDNLSGYEAWLQANILEPFESAINAESDD